MGTAPRALWKGPVIRCVWIHRLGELSMLTPPGDSSQAALPSHMSRGCVVPAEDADCRRGGFNRGVTVTYRAVGNGHVA